MLKNRSLGVKEISGGFYFHYSSVHFNFVNKDVSFYENLLSSFNKKVRGYP